MTTYAGYTSIGDYLKRRCAKKKISLMQLDVALGFSRRYSYAVVAGQITPSPARLNQYAEFFGDAPHIPRVLAGLESPAPVVKDRTLREVVDIALRFNRSQLNELLKFALYLRDRDK